MIVVPKCDLTKNRFATELILLKLRKYFQKRSLCRMYTLWHNIIIIQNTVSLFMIFLFRTICSFSHIYTKKKKK